LPYVLALWAKQLGIEPIRGYLPSCAAHPGLDQSDRKGEISMMEKRDFYVKRREAGVSDTA
jgi:hypothetical protein